MSTPQACSEIFHVSILRMPHAIAKWQLVYNYLELRNEVFVERKEWDLPTYDTLEFEQYDGGNKPHYVIAHKGSQVLAGVRLLRCDEEEHAHPHSVSYMIRDAYLGRINLPRALWTNGEPPTDNTTWELTRFVSSVRDMDVTRAVLKAANEYMKRLGGAQVLFLSHPALLRVAQKHGFKPVPQGPILGNESGKFQVARCDLL